MSKIKKIKVNNISELFKEVSSLDMDNKSILTFRGDSKEYVETALTAGIYRDDYIENEDIIYREIQRFNDDEFTNDTTTFDRLSRMQHYNAPTRLLDISEDLMSAIYFAIGERNPKSIEEEKQKDDSIIYILKIKKSSIKYYDSDTVSVISNLVKIPMKNDNEKSKNRLIYDIKGRGVTKFNKQKSAKFLRHEIREEKPQFEAIINPRHLTSVQCVRPKLTSHRIRSQKGLFLLFGLNPDNIEKSIMLIDDNKLLEDERINHPITEITKIHIPFSKIEEMKEELKKVGITKAFIYPEIDKVSEYIKEEYKNAKK
jgi:hypothetical protein